MKNKTFNIFKIEYSWYEGEYEATFLGKWIEQREFEKDLIKAKKFAEGLIGKETKDFDYLGKGYNVECLPEYYNQIIWFLMIKLRYTVCYMNNNLRYNVDSGEDNIQVRREEEKVEREDLK